MTHYFLTLQICHSLPHQSVATTSSSSNTSAAGGVGGGSSITDNDGGSTSASTSSNLMILYMYKQDNLLMGDFPDHIFYSTIQEHLHREHTFTELDDWLTNYRKLILASKQQKADSALTNTIQHGGLNRSSRVDVIL